MGKRGPGSMSYLKYTSVMRNIKTDVVHDAFFQYVSLFGAYVLSTSVNVLVTGKSIL